MKKRNSIRWRLPVSYAAIALLTTFALGLVLRTILRNYYDRQETGYLQMRAIEISSIASQLLEADLPPQMIQDLSKSWSVFLQARVRVLDADGNQIVDSGVPKAQQVFFIASEKPLPIQVQTGGPETALPVHIPPGSSEPVPAKANRIFQVQILNNDGAPGLSQTKNVVVFNKGAAGVTLSADATMNGLLDPIPGKPGRRSTQVVTQPVVDQKNGNLLGKVILSDGPAYGDEILNNVMNGWIVASTAAVILAALAGWLVSTRIATPLTELTRVTARMSQGDLSARAGSQPG